MEWVEKPTHRVGSRRHYSPKQSGKSAYPSGTTRTHFSQYSVVALDKNAVMYHHVKW
jgi:hypothetical protein